MAPTATNRANRSMVNTKEYAAANISSDTRNIAGRYCIAWPSAEKNEKKNTTLKMILMMANRKLVAESCLACCRADATAAETASSGPISGAQWNIASGKHTDTVDQHTLMTNHSGMMTSTKFAPLKCSRPATIYANTNAPR